MLRKRDGMVQEGFRSVGLGCDWGVVASAVGVGRCEV